MEYTNPDAIEVNELLDVVATKIPDMITKILRSVYSEDAGRSMGRAVGGLYTELLAAGIPKDVAVKMASDYMISLKDLMGVFGDESAGGQSGWAKWRGDSTRPTSPDNQESSDAPR